MQIRYVRIQFAIALELESNEQMENKLCVRHLNKWKYASPEQQNECQGIFSGVSG